MQTPAMEKPPVNDSQNLRTRPQKALSFTVVAILVSLTALSASAQTTDSTTPPADSTAPDSTAPDSTAPDSTAPDSTAPDSTAPDSTAPDSTEAAPPADAASMGGSTTTTETEPGGTVITTTTSDASALGDGTTTTTTVAPDGTTVSTTVPASTNPDEAAEEVQAEREPLAWRNSYFNYSINSSFCSFSRDCQLSYNPTVYTFLSLSPRWYLDPATFFTFYQALYIEHTNDDGATYQHEAQLFDTRIGLNHREALGTNFLILPGASLWLPASKTSQAAQRYFRLGASVSGTWDPGVGGFNLSAQLSYVHWFAGSNVAQTGSPYPGSTAGPSLQTPNGDPVANQANSTTSETDRVTAGLTANWQPLSGFTITLQIFYFWLQGWGLSNAAIPGVTTTGAGDFVVGDASPSHWRAFDSYNLYFQYDFVPWLQGWIGFSNSTQLASVFNADGSARSPVSLYDMQVSLGATITLDSLYESFAVAGEDDGLTPEQRQRRRQGLASRSSSGGSL